MFHASNGPHWRNASNEYKKNKRVYEDEQKPYSQKPGFIEEPFTRLFVLATTTVCLFSVRLLFCFPA